MKLEKIKFSFTKLRKPMEKEARDAFQIAYKIMKLQFKFTQVLYGMLEAC